MNIKKSMRDRILHILDWDKSKGDVSDAERSERFASEPIVVIGGKTIHEPSDASDD